MVRVPKSSRELRRNSAGYGDCRHRTATLRSKPKRDAETRVAAPRCRCAGVTTRISHPLFVVYRRIAAKPRLSDAHVLSQMELTHADDIVQASIVHRRRSLASPDLPFA